MNNDGYHGETWKDSATPSKESTLSGCFFFENAEAAVSEWLTRVDNLSCMSDKTDPSEIVALVLMVLLLSAPRATGSAWLVLRTLVGHRVSRGSGGLRAERDRPDCACQAVLAVGRLASMVRLASVWTVTESESSTWRPWIAVRLSGPWLGWQLAAKVQTVEFCRRPSAA